MTPPATASISRNGALTRAREGCKEGFNRVRVVRLHEDNWRIHPCGGRGPTRPRTKGRLSKDDPPQVPRMHPHIERSSVTRQLEPAHCFLDRILDEPVTVSQLSLPIQQVVHKFHGIRLTRYNKFMIDRVSNHFVRPAQRRARRGRGSRRRPPGKGLT